jgi:hypothetical protein
VRRRLWFLPLVLVATSMTFQSVDPADIGIRIDSITPKPGALSVSVQVFDNAAGTTVDDADVRVTYRKGDGSESKAQSLDPGTNGMYRGDVTFPDGGEYTIHISANSGGNVELVQTVPDPPATKPDRTGSTESGSDDGSDVGLVVAIVGIAVVAIVAVGLLVGRRRRSKGDGAVRDATEPLDPPADPVDES